MAESESHPSTQLIRTWASSLAGESRPYGWIRESYVCPDEIARLARQKDIERPDLIGLVGAQGVGKSSALTALHQGLPGMLTPRAGRVQFKWRKPPELYDTLLDTDLRREYILQYLKRLVNELMRPTVYFRLNREDRAELSIFIKQLGNYTSDNESGEPNLRLAEQLLGARRISKFRQEAWLQIISSKDLIMIDTPDYSKTDKRRMDNDLNEIYWLWNSLASKSRAPKLIIAIQKEMFHDHFFLDKMQTIELKPLSTKQILKAYRKRFRTFSPFTEEAITLLAKMSRGIFRRFLRYITLTLDLWDSKHQKSPSIIDVSLVKQAVTIDHLTNAMENELTPLFRNSSQQRTLAVKTVMLLWEHNEMKQSALATQLEIAPATISRILTTLENAKYITHRYDGKEKIILYKESENIIDN